MADDSDFAHHPPHVSEAYLAQARAQHEAHRRTNPYRSKSAETSARASAAALDMLTNDGS